MKFIIGYKKEMTQQYREDGTVVPVTVVKAEPIVVTQIKSNEKEGYSSIQLGIGNRKKTRKSQAGHLSKVLATGRNPFAKLKEMRVQDSAAFKVGDSINVNVFQVGDIVNVSGVSKGKGFQGVVKRHGFAGSPASHGHKDQLRMPGSIGAQNAQHVFKGKKMGGRMGTDRVTVKNLEIVSVDPEANLLFVKGALPGARNSIIEIIGAGDFSELVNIFETKVAPVKEDSSDSKKEVEEEKEQPKEVKEEKPSTEKKESNETESKE